MNSKTVRDVNCCDEDMDGHEDGIDCSLSCVTDSSAGELRVAGRGRSRGKGRGVGDEVLNDSLFVPLSVIIL